MSRGRFIIFELRAEQGLGRESSFLFGVRPYMSQISSAVQTGRTKCIKKDLCYTRALPDSRRHLRLCFPLSISFLCTFLSSLKSALIYNRFPLQSRLERRSVLKNDLCHTRTFPDSRRHTHLCFPLSISFLCTFLSSAHFFPRA